MRRAARVFSSSSGRSASPRRRFQRPARPLRWTAVRGRTSRRRATSSGAASAWTVAARITSGSATTVTRPEPSARSASSQPPTRTRRSRRDSPPCGAAVGSDNQAATAGSSAAATAARDRPRQRPMAQPASPATGSGASPRDCAVRRQRTDGEQYARVEADTAEATASARAMPSGSRGLPSSKRTSRSAPLVPGEISVSRTVIGVLLGRRGGELESGGACGRGVRARSVRGE